MRECFLANECHVIGCFFVIVSTVLNSTVIHAALMCFLTWHPIYAFIYKIALKWLVEWHSADKQGSVQRYHPMKQLEKCGRIYFESLNAVWMFIWYTHISQSQFFFFLALAVVVSACPGEAIIVSGCWERQSTGDGICMSNWLRLCQHPNESCYSRTFILPNFPLSTENIASQSQIMLNLFASPLVVLKEVQKWFNSQWYPHFCGDHFILGLLTDCKENFVGDATGIEIIGHEAWLEACDRVGPSWCMWDRVLWYCSVRLRDKINIVYTKSSKWKRLTSP